MVVLAASILEKGKSGNILFSRQFIPLSRNRIESLLHDFPKLISNNDQHTFVETESVRYIYQTIDDVNLVLITNKQSDICEDMDTLRLLARLVPEQVGNVTSENITHNAFELLFAFDEVLNMGVKENLTLQQVNTFLEMDSHEEKLARIESENKKSEAKLLAQQRAAEIDRKKQELKEQGYSTYTPEDGPSGGMGGGPTSSSSGSGYGYYNEEDNTEEEVKAEHDKEVRQELTKQAVQAISTNTASNVSIVQSGRVKGLSLNKKTVNKQAAFMQELALHDADIDVEAAYKPVTTQAPPQPTTQTHQTPHLPPATAVAKEEEEEDTSHLPPTVSVLESVEIELDRSGVCKAMRVSGQLKLTLFNDLSPHLSIQLNNTSKIGKFNTSQWRPQMRPGLDRNLLNNGVIALQDKSRAFAVGAHNSNPLMRWKYADTDGSYSPFTVSIWVNPDASETQVNIELVKNLDYDSLANNVIVYIPCPMKPTVDECDGDFFYDDTNKRLCWRLVLLNDSNMLAFIVNLSADEESFFPSNVTFKCDQSLAGIEVVSITDLKTNEHIVYDVRNEISSENVKIE